MNPPPSKRPILFPERRLDSRQIADLTGLHKYTIMHYFKQPDHPLSKGAAMLGGKISVPESSYNGWIAFQKGGPPLPKPAVPMPEQRLSGRQIYYLTGLDKPTILKLVKDPANPLAVGFDLTRGKISIPISSYNEFAALLADGQMSYPESRRAAKLPRPRLDARQIAALACLHKLTILDIFKRPDHPLAKGATMLGGKISVPMSSYNGWLRQSLLVKPQTVNPKEPE